MLADIENLHDVSVADAGDGLGLGAEASRAVVANVGPLDHLEGNGAVEAHVPGLEDDAHAAPAEHGLHLVARYARQGHVLRQRRLRTGSQLQRGREECVEIGPEATHLPPLVADRGQEFRARPADLFGRGPGVEKLLQQFVQAVGRRRYGVRRLRDGRGIRSGRIIDHGTFPACNILGFRNYWPLFGTVI